MSGLFGKPDIKTPEPKPIPTVDEARMNVDQQLAARRRQGRAATQRVQEEGAVSTAAKTLTGN